MWRARCGAVAGRSVRIGSLCTGYGGLDMAVEAYFDAETIWTSEIDKYASEVITQRINKPNLGDLKKIDWHAIEPIDIITAGYPCQPFSHAGLRKGIEDERHIWPYIKEAISILRPRFVILENVRGHFGLGFREVLADLAAIRYDARWTLVRASDAGAPHRRERLFVLADAEGSWSRQQPRISASILEYGNSIAQHSDSDGFGRTLGYDEGRTQGNQGKSQSISNKLVETIYNQEVPNALDQDGKLNSKFVEYMMGLPSGWVTECGLSRSQQLKILGNGVVPQQAYLALQLLMNNE
jgi:DNA (cytosine-5)-methyltransferase 1